MLKLAGLQRTLAALYRIDLDCDVDDYVRPMDPGDPEAHRGEVVLVAEGPDGATEIAVVLDPRVSDALTGCSANDASANDAQTDTPIPRFTAWCMALEGVSHFTLLAFRAACDRPVSHVELELQADVDKFAVGVIQRCVYRAPHEASRAARALRLALFDAVAFHDDPGTDRGVRYRLAHRVAARYAHSLEQRYVRHGRLPALLEELRDFYRAGLTTKFEMALAG